MESPCSRCGCNRPFHDNVAKATKTVWEIREWAKKQAASAASMIADRDLQILELKEGQKWLQQKVKNQSAAIRKLEEKVIKLGKLPYEKEDEPKPEPIEITVKNKAPEIPTVRRGY